MLWILHGLRWIPDTPDTNTDRFALFACLLALSSLFKYSLHFLDESPLCCPPSMLKLKKKDDYFQLIIRSNQLDLQKNIKILNLPIDDGRWSNIFIHLSCCYWKGFIYDKTLSISCCTTLKIAKIYFCWNIFAAQLLPSCCSTNETKFWVELKFS